MTKKAVEATQTVEVEFPQGDGDPKCEKCRGRGVVPLPVGDRPPRAMGEFTTPCTCTLVRYTLKNIERGWKGLSQAEPLPEASPLRGEEAHNLFVTAPVVRFKEHLKHVAARMGPNWNFKVVSDAELMDAWLSPDMPDIKDMDVDQMRRTKVSGQYAMLVDLVEPPELLIIMLGVKAARNSAMPEVMLEALNQRIHTDKPTWVVDQPSYRLNRDHISYSEHVAGVLTGWTHIRIAEEVPAAHPMANDSVLPVQMMGVPMPTPKAKPLPAPEPESPEEEVDTEPEGEEELPDDLKKLLRTKDQRISDQAQDKRAKQNQRRWDKAKKGGK